MTPNSAERLFMAAAVASAAAQRPALVEGRRRGINIPDLHDQYGQDRCQEQTGLAGRYRHGRQLGGLSPSSRRYSTSARLRICPEGGKARSTSNPTSIDVPVLASFRLLKPVRIYAGPVFTVMNDCKQKSGGDLLDFGRVRPRLPYGGRRGGADAPPADRPALQRPVPSRSTRWCCPTEVSSINSVPIMLRSASAIYSDL